MTSGGDFHEDQLIKLLLKNANTIDGFKRNWWSDKHEYHLESCYFSVLHRVGYTVSCKVTQQNVEGCTEA